MNRRAFIVVTGFAGLAVVFFVLWILRVLNPSILTVDRWRDRAWPISDLESGRVYRYGDFRKCHTPDGGYYWDWHFTGRDRSVRNQLTLPGVQVLNDSTLLRGYMRIFIVSERIVEGHLYGGNRVVQFNGPIRSLYPVEPCGPERGREAK